MAHEIEEVETGSESSYTRVSPSSEKVGEMSSAVVSENEDAHATHPVPSDTAESEAWKKDSTFFFAFVTFRVEDQLFRVPKDAFENQSEHFRTLFTNVSTGLGGNPTGDINEPIFLDGVEKDAFRNLLRLMYPPPMTSPFTGSILLDREQWIKILDLAQTWGFAGIRDLAIKQLELAKFEEVEKLELALKYDIKQWYADAYFALAKRPEPLSIEEGRRLGLELSMKIARVRERRMAHAMERMSNSESVASGSSGFAAFGGSYIPFGTTPSSSVFGCKKDDNAAASTSEATKQACGPAGVAPSGKAEPASESGPAAQAQKGASHFTEKHTPAAKYSFTFGPPSPPEFGKPTRVVKTLKQDATKSTSFYDDTALKRDIKKTFGL